MKKLLDKIVDVRSEEMRALGLGLTGISFIAASLAALWCLLSLWLGGKRVALARKA